MRLLETQLYNWFIRAQGTAGLCGSVLQEKACEIARQNGVEDTSKIDLNWINRFKARRGIVAKKLHGHIQPMDAGIMKNLKHFNRKKIIRMKIQSMDNDVDFSIKLFRALLMLDKAWKCVTTATIINCFQHVSFVVQSETMGMESINEDYECFVVEGQGQIEVLGDVSMAEYNDCDALTTSEFATEVSQVTDDTSADDEQASQDEILEVTSVIVKEAVESLKVLEKFFLQQEDGLESVRGL